MPDTDGSESQPTTPSPQSDANRRLATVMFLDIVSYSAMMAHSETRAMACVAEFERILAARVPANGGRVVKFMGDGSMVEFPNAKGAVVCAQEVQADIDAHNHAKEVECHFKVRIGLHLGELIEQRGDIFGDSVNIAARIQPLAYPGGLAMSYSVYSAVKNQMPLRGRLKTGVKLKNIPGKNHIFLLPPSGTSYTRWYLSTHRWGAATITGLLVAAIIAAVAGIGPRIWSSGPTRMGLIYIESGGTKSETAISSQFVKEVGWALAGSKEVAWVGEDGVQDIFLQEGIKNYRVEERVEEKACQAARSGGLAYVLDCRLQQLPGGNWQVETKITCTSTRVVFHSFRTQGKNPKELGAGVAREVNRWVTTL